VLQIAFVADDNDGHGAPTFDMRNLRVQNKDLIEGNSRGDGIYEQKSFSTIGYVLIPHGLEPPEGSWIKLDETTTGRMDLLEIFQTGNSAHKDGRDFIVDHVRPGMPV